MNKMVKKLTFATLTVLAVSASSFVLADTNKMTEEADNTNIKATAKVQSVKVTPAQASIMAYDLNNDGMLSPAEVGNKLFYQFDRDGNESLDNIEWNKSIMLDLAPMEKITVTKMDFDGDGIMDSEAVEVDVFMKRTGLERFDNDGDGLSPREFIGKSVLQMDTDKSGLIELQEWRKAYKESMSPKPANNEIYNDGQ